MGEYSDQPRRGAGGTPGGLLEFIIGAGLTIGGGYLFLSRVTVQSSFMTLWGYNGFGVALIPLMLGLGVLFFNGRSLWGWLLTIGAMIIIFLGIITNLTFYFQPTSLITTLIMLGMLAGGLGLIARALRPH